MRKDGDMTGALQSKCYLADGLLLDPKHRVVYRKDGMAAYVNLSMHSSVDLQLHNLQEYRTQA